jgi:hypothetical protein
MQEADGEQRLEAGRASGSSRTRSQVHIWPSPTGGWSEFRGQKWSGLLDNSAAKVV